MPPDPNEMTEQECIKWLTLEIYKKVACNNDCGSAWIRKSDGLYFCNGTHKPIPANLDAAAAAMPKGWSVYIENDATLAFSAAAWPKGTDPTETIIQVCRHRTSRQIPSRCQGEEVIENGGSMT